MANIGYARVSTKDQRVDLQMDALKLYDCERIFIDHGERGAKRNRPEWDKCWESLQEGDVLVIYKLDRVGRSLRNLIEIVEDLKSKGVEIKTIDGDLDTTTSAGKLMFNIMASFAEYERELIRERVISGMEAAKARGKNIGRPREISDISIEAMKYYIEEENLHLVEAAKLSGISRASAYRLKKEGKL
jgi:DNA invertase Pin-like site-specific DNA recombinase